MTKLNETPAFITLADAAQMSRKVGLNRGKGISPSTIRRWCKRGYCKGGFPIRGHANIPGQIDFKMWADYIGGTPAAEIETATIQREIQRRNAFMEGVTK